MNSCPTCQQRIRSDGSGLESELTTWLEAEAEQHRKTRNEWFLKIEKLEAEVAVLKAKIRELEDVGF